MISKAVYASVRSVTKNPLTACLQNKFNVSGARRSALSFCSVTEEAAPSAEAPAEPLPTGDLDIRVGKILSVEKHPDADSLYVESIEVGEEEPRTIVSGLVKYVTEDELSDRDVIVICNLKARNMRGVKSHGMVLCASNSERTVIEPLQPPQGCQPGERVTFEENQPEPAKENRVQKKKLWEAVQPDLKTNDEMVATFQGIPMLTKLGPVKSSSLKDAQIS